MSTSRKELIRQYRETRRPAGVYRIVNRRTGKSLLDATSDLNAARGKFEFARSTRLPAALDRRLADDVREYGFDAFELEVLEVLDVKPEQTDEQVRADLAALAALWREKLGEAALY